MSRSRTPNSGKEKFHSKTDIFGPKTLILALFCEHFQRLSAGGEQWTKKGLDVVFILNHNRAQSIAVYGVETSSDQKYCIYSVFF